MKLFKSLTASGVLAGLALTSVAALLPATEALALPPETTPVFTITPAAGGNGNSTLSLNWTGNLYCPYSSSGVPPTSNVVNSFIAPVSEDPTNFTWPGGAPTSTTSNNVYGLLAPTTFEALAGLTTGSTQVPGSGYPVSTFVPQFSLQAQLPGDFVNGAYNVGVACVSGNTTLKYWMTPITITNVGSGGGDPGITWSVGLPTAAPTAPTVTASQSGAGTVAATWTAPTANPAVTSYDVTLKQGATTIGAPQLGLTTLATTFSGVPNGTGYTVEVVAHNTVGASPAGVSSSFNITAGAQGAPSLSVAPGANAGELLASWTTPTGLAPSGYSLSVETGGVDIALSPFSESGNSQLVTGLTAGTVYAFQVTATYSDPSAVATPSNTVSAAPAAADSLQQVIQVERPAGALILTQRCGVNGALAAEPAVAGFPGFPAVGAIAVDQAGATAPTLVPGGGPDPEFPDYPFANPDVKTQCILDLGTAQLLTSGDLAGQYYAADGALNEITVVDTRQGDNGWTVTGSIPSLSNGGAGAFDSFSGSLVGWTPKVSATTDPAGASVYDQVVAPGTPVVPGTAPGLSSATGQVLAKALPGAGLGIAVLDARVKVLIPVANNNGDYSGILTINAA